MHRTNTYLRSLFYGLLAQMPLLKCLAVLSFSPICCTILLIIVLFKEYLDKI